MELFIRPHAIDTSKEHTLESRCGPGNAPATALASVVRSYARSSILHSGFIDSLSGLVMSLSQFFGNPLYSFI